jgi:hypothetical protein
MNPSFIRSSLLVLATTFFLCAPPTAFGQSRVFVDQTSIDQSYDQRNHAHAISGSLENMLPVGIANVEVRLYFYQGPGKSPKKLWKEKVAQIGMRSRAPFTFLIDPDELAGAKGGFIVRLWRYELETEDAKQVLSLAEEGTSVELNALTTALARLAKSQSQQINEWLQERNALARLCLAEATLSNADPRAMRYLVERLLASEEVIDRKLLAEKLAAVDPILEPPLFANLLRWPLTGNARADAASLVSAFPAAGIPLLVRMRYTSTGIAAQFANDELQDRGATSIEQQLAFGDDQTRENLISVYQELASLFPNDVSIRHALGAAERRVHAVFWLLAIAFSILLPWIRAWRSGHRFG